MYRTVYDKLIYPLHHFLRGDSANAAIQEMDSHDSMSPDEMICIESQKLENLLSHAGESVPYYRRVFEETGVMVDGACDLSRFRFLPLLTKDVIRHEFENLISCNLERNRIDPNSTSGSSGSPLNFFTDLRSKCYRKGAVARNRKWIGVRRGDPVVHLWGSPIDSNKASALRGKLHGLVTRELYLSAYQLREADMHEYSRRVRQFRPKLLVGYPSILQEFAAFCVGNKIYFPSIRAIVCSAETLYAHQREAIESAYSVPVFNRYGCREVGDIAHEVPGVTGLVVNSDRIHLEVLNDDGRPCKPGEIGEIVVTDLDNFGMPLIRYRVGDRGAWSQQELRTEERPYPVLESVDGRTLDVVVTPDGNHIGGTYWTILLRQRPGIDMFQVLQRDPGGIEVRFVLRNDANQIDEHFFRKKIAELCGDDFEVVFREVDRIEPDSTGKFRIVVSELGANDNGQRCGVSE